MVLDGHSILSSWISNFPVDVQNTLRAQLASDSMDNYSIYFRKFSRFCDQTLQPGEVVSIQTFLSYLQTAVTAKKSYSTIKMMSASVNFFLSKIGINFLSDPYYEQFMKGANRLAPLPMDKMVTWDPMVVLKYIADSPASDDFLSIAHEAVSLLLLATGLRVDDVWKFSENVTFEHDRARFRFRLPRKCDMVRRLKSYVDVQRYSVVRICPVNAVFRFVNAAASIRKSGNSALFVSSKGKDAAKATLRSWFCHLLFAAGIRSSAGSSRSAVTSAAHYRGIKLGEIMKAAGWSSECTFRAYYCRPVENVPINLLPPAP